MKHTILEDIFPEATARVRLDNHDTYRVSIDDQVSEEIICLET